MRLTLSSVVFASVVATSTVFASHEHCDHDHADQMPLDYVKFPYEQPLYRTSSGEGKYLSDTLPLVLNYLSQVTADAIFSGITTFAHLSWLQCLSRQQDVPVDIAFLGAPFVSL